MKKFSFVNRLIENLEKIGQSSKEIRDGISNQSALLNDRFKEIVSGLNNEQHIINDKLSELIENLNSFQADSNQRLSTIAASLEGNSSTELIVKLVDRQKILENKLDELISVLLALHGRPGAGDALRSAPLLRASKTYNTDHPDYDPALVRNFPGVLLNADKPSANPALRAIRQVTQLSETNDRAWPDQLEMALAELQSIPGAEQLFQRKEVAERFFLEINSRYPAHYQPGWVNLDDGLFLYWLIRRLRPRVVVETGVANGFSTGVILLALAKNGNGGKLHAIGRAEIFNANDPRWTEEGRTFGEVVVDGKSLGWMVPDNCRNSVEFYSGDAATLLPETVANLDAIDLFFHDSDHSYDHMMFEFEAAKRRLSPLGVVVADNIAWNSSLWDFADHYGVPAYNFRGSVGAAFFG